MHFKKVWSCPLLTIKIVGTAFGFADFLMAVSLLLEALRITLTDWFDWLADRTVGWLTALMQLVGRRAGVGPQLPVVPSLLCALESASLVAPLKTAGYTPDTYRVKERGRKKRRKAELELEGTGRKEKKKRVLKEGGRGRRGNVGPAFPASGVHSSGDISQPKSPER